MPTITPASAPAPKLDPSPSLPYSTAPSSAQPQPSSKARTPGISSELMAKDLDAVRGTTLIGWFDHQNTISDVSKVQYIGRSKNVAVGAAEAYARAGKEVDKYGGALAWVSFQGPVSKDYYVAPIASPQTNTPHSMNGAGTGWGGAEGWDWRNTSPVIRSMSGEDGYGRGRTLLWNGTQAPGQVAKPVVMRRWGLIDSEM